ncbi:hypothetical protein M9H77_36508 [Catharanthus roseus]|uniref:Uncharacterized protein n=1 Tax=Catharanthus roseus TaxID=4058 RepID=A0ACB9ZSU2_CATRO|nr:hypothetical protein M9H77_36508 [Catharanthus roseus]
MESQINLLVKLIAEGPLGSLPRNMERIIREYSEAVTSQSVEEQVNTFSIHGVDKEETTAQTLKESTFSKEEEAQQEIMEKRYDSLPIIDEPSQCVPENMSEVEEGDPEKENNEVVNFLTQETNQFLVYDSLCIQVPWTQSKENNKKRRNLIEFRGKFESR